MNRLRLAALSGAAVLALGLAACGDSGGTGSGDGSSSSDSQVSGTIRIASSHGGGTTARVSLPLH